MVIRDGISTKEDHGNYETITITGVGQYTEPITVVPRSWYDSRVNISIDPGAACNMTVVLQRQYYEETSTWHDVQEWTVTTETDIEHITDKNDPETIKYRIGCKAYTAGTCALRVGAY